MLPSACLDGVGTSNDSDCRAQYPAYACPCHRSTPSLAADGVWLRVGMVCYAFPVRLFHPLHSSRFLGFPRLASGCWPGFAGRDWLPAGFPRKVSELLTSHPPCPGFTWRTIIRASYPPDSRLGVDP